MAFKFTAPKKVSVGFSIQQITASEEVLENFSQGIVRYNILLAQMQSGKTETYLLTAWEMVRRTGKIENVVIFSGNSEIYLKGQLTATLKGNIFRDKYEAYLSDKVDNPKACLQALEQWAQFDSELPKFQILWGIEIKKYRGPSRNTLFIWEESHYAQTLKQSPDTFLQRMGISPNGDIETFTKKENFMISISATPFSELSDRHHLGQNKKIVFMLPGDGYNSVKRMRDNGKINVYANLADGINRALTSAESTRRASYAIIRITPRTAEETEEIITQHNATIESQQRWKICYFDSLTTGKEKENGDRVWKNMCNAPPHNTVILIRGKCRMGHDLSKNYLAFVMETSKKPNTDTLLQGLLGRACGYPRSAVVEEDNIYQVEVYLYEKIVKSKEIDRYIEMVDTVHDGVIEVLPKKAKNLAKSKEITGDPIIPIRVSRALVNNDRKQILQDINEAFTTQQQIENKNTEKNYQEVREKFLRTFEDKQFGKLRVFYMDEKKTKSSTRNGEMARKVHHAFENGIAQNFGSGVGIDADNTEINIWVIKRVNGMDSSKIYITSRVQYVPLSYDLITKTNRKEVFACNITEELKVEANGGFAILLPAESAFNIQLLQQKIMEFIQLSIDHETSKQIRSLWDLVEKQEKGILLTPEVFASLQKKGVIYELVKRTFGLQLKLTKTRGRIEKSVKDSGLIKLESISW